MVPVGASTEACELRKPCSVPSASASSHDAVRRRRAGRLDGARVDLVDRRAVLGDHPQHRLLVLLVAVERAGDLRDLRGGAVGVTGHQRRDRPAPRPTLVGVVGQAEAHQQPTEVGVADAQLAVVDRVLADRLGRVAREPDDDLLRGEDHLDRPLVASTSNRPAS
jgi:hypothetical protein